MKIAVVYTPDPGLGPDPLDVTARKDRSMGDFIDSDHHDVILVWREYGEEFEGGARTHVTTSGAWENVTDDQVIDALTTLSDLPE